MPERRLQAKAREAGPESRRRTGTGARRPADRHYLAVVAAEARRLGRQLRPPLPRGPIHPEGSH
jgi:hypothetical protein